MRPSFHKMRQCLLLVNIWRIKTGASENNLGLLAENISVVREMCFFKGLLNFRKEKLTLMPETLSLEKNRSALMVSGF